MGWTTVRDNTQKTQIVLGPCLIRGFLRSVVSTTTNSAVSLSLSLGRVHKSPLFPPSPPYPNPRPHFDVSSVSPSLVSSPVSPSSHPTPTSS